LLGSNFTNPIGLLSHELMEMLANPFCAAVRSPYGRIMREVVDPVHALAYYIPVTVDGINYEVEVNDFVLPSWFGGQTGPYDYMGELNAAWQLGPAGNVNHL
jgi:hypothetical protein